MGDIGCSDSQLNDKDCTWDPTKKTFFLNEIEPSSTTYFVRHLKFDCIPVYGKLIANTTRELHRAMQKRPLAALKKARRTMKAAVAKKSTTSSRKLTDTKMIKAMKTMKVKVAKTAMKSKAMN